MSDQTPAERIAAAVTRIDGKGCTPSPELAADAALLALCPKGKSIRLDRTGGTDRLVRQEFVGFTNDQAQHCVWVDIEDGSA